MDPAVETIVVRATKAAIQEGAASTRWRTRIESLLIGALVASAIAIPTTAALTKETAATARNNARVNCQLIRELAQLGQERLVKEKADTRRFEKESSDRLGLTPKRFDELIVRKQTEDAQRQTVFNRVARHNCGDK